MKKILIILWIALFMVLAIQSFRVDASEVASGYNQEQRETKLAIVKQEIWADHLSEQIKEIKEVNSLSENVVFDGFLVLLIFLGALFFFLKIERDLRKGHNVAVFVNCRGERYQVICRCVEHDGKERVVSPFVSPKSGAEINAPSIDVLRKRSLVGCLRQDIFAEQKKQLIKTGKIIKIS